METRVVAGAAQKFFVRALLDDLAVAENENPVRVTHR